MYVEKIWLNFFMDDWYFGYMTKSFFLNLTSNPQFLFLFFAIFSCCTKSDNQPQEDLAKYGYKKI
jgi:hypothetical protein